MEAIGPKISLFPCQFTADMIAYSADFIINGVGRRCLVDCVERERERGRDGPQVLSMCHSNLLKQVKGLKKQVAHELVP